MDASIRRKSLTLTILIHGLILLALFFFVITTRIPPFDEGTIAGGGGGGVIIDIGQVTEALDASSSQKQSTPVEEQPASTQDENIMTTEYEPTTTVAVNKNKKIKKIKENKVVKNKKIEKKDVKEEKPQIKVPVVDQRNIFHPHSQGSSTTAAEGQQGSPNGKPGGSQYPGMGGNGNGTGTGQGTGSGPGIGAGNGPFSGIRWGDGRGRNILTAPQFKSKTNEPGKVTLKIYVDENGNVTQVERSETQTLNPTQVNEAIEYVKKVKFTKGSGISVAYPTIEFSAK